jgi:hypothetical protein
VLLVSEKTDGLSLVTSLVAGVLVFFVGGRPPLPLVDEVTRLDAAGGIVQNCLWQLALLAKFFQKLAAKLHNYIWNAAPLSIDVPRPFFL